MVGLDHQDFRHFLYGREKEVEYLQSVLRRVLGINHPIDVNDDDRVIQNVALPSMKQVEKCRDVSVGSQYTCKSGNTECTTVPDEDHPSTVDATAATLPHNFSNNHNDVLGQDKRCQLVLVRGPIGCGKRSFIRGTINRFAASQAVVECNTSTLEEASSRESSSFPRFLFVEGRCRQYQSNSANKRSNLVGKEVPLVAFDEALREIFFFLQESPTFLEGIRELFLSMSEDPVAVKQTLMEAYPFMKSWLNTDMYAHSSTSVKIDSRDDVMFPSTRRSEVISNTRATLRQEIFISQEARDRCSLIVKLFRAVSSYIPVVLYIQDLHVADEVTIAIVEALLQEGNKLAHESKGLLIVASWQAHENIRQSNSFASFLQCYNKVKRPDQLMDSQSEVTLNTPELANPQAQVPPEVHDIYIKLYSLQNIHKWIHDIECTKSLSDDIKSDLTNLVFRNSNGKPLIIHFLLLLLELNKETIIYEDVHQLCSEKDFGSVYKEIIMRQSISFKETCQSMAALAYHNSDNDINIDDLLLATSLDELCFDAVKIGSKSGLFEYKISRRCINFCHKELLQASYNSIPEKDRPRLHITIGRRLLKRTPYNSGETESNDYELRNRCLLAASLLANHIDLLTEMNERYLFSKALYEVGKESAIVGDFDSAAKLFNFSIRILGDRVWNDALYETSLVLHNSLAQAYCCTGDDDQVHYALDEVFDHARTFEDRIPACITLAHFYGARKNNFVSALQTASNALHGLGETINENTTYFFVAINFIKTKRRIQRKSIDELANLPFAENEKDIAVALLYCQALIYSFVTKAKVSMMILLRMLHLSIRKGVSGPSAVAFSFYGFILSASGNAEEGHRMGQVALKLAARFAEFKPRVAFFVYAAITHWIYPLRDSMLSLYQSTQKALIYGDVEIFTASANSYVLGSLVSGTSLTKLESISRSFCHSMIGFGQYSALLWAVPLWGLISKLVCNEEPLNGPANFTDADSALKFAIREKIEYPLGQMYMLQTMWFYLIGDYSEAIASANMYNKHRKVLEYTLTFYKGAALLAAARTATTRRLKPCYRPTKYSNSHIHRGRMMAHQMKVFADRCPANFRNKQYLLEAELASLTGKASHSVEQLYQQSIDLGMQEGMIHEVGIAYERWGYHLLDYHHQQQNGKNTMSEEARGLFIQARTAYEQWGAIRLVRRIDTFLTVSTK